MKNLFVKIKLSLQVAKKVAAHCIDADNGHLFVLTQDFEVLKISTGDPSETPQAVCGDFSFPNSEVTFEDVKLFEYNVESGSILLALKDGTTIRLGVSSFNASSEYTYRHPTCISSMSFSPDQDLIALADDKNGIQIMSMDLSTIFYSANAITDCNSIHKPVAAGWGSKETQFFGLDGRPSKEKQCAQSIDLDEKEKSLIEGIESSPIFIATRRNHELHTVIDWRGDGQLLATLTFLPDDGKHYLKVWNRNLELQYMSEQLVSIERGILSWIPDGKYVCCAQQRDKQINEILMFEKNGMVHQRLPIPTTLKNSYIQDIAWSGNSKILAVIVNQFIAIGDRIQYKPILMLYTMQNFHYYLKYSTYLDENCKHFIDWDPIEPQKLRIMSSAGNYTEYSFSFGVTFSNDRSTVAVVDANKIYLTPMQCCSIPPPMSAATIELDSLISNLILDENIANKMRVVTLCGIIESSPTNLTSRNEARFSITVHNKGAEELCRELKFYQITDTSTDIDNKFLKNSNEYVECQGMTIALTDDSSLLVDSKVLSSKVCTSFRTTENYLVYTTTDNNMHFILLSDLSKVTDFRTTSTWSQAIEPGGTLVVVSELESKVVLQMPRGNLEILYPRVLVFSTITHLLDSKAYLDTMKIARRQRLNLNFIADYLLRAYGASALNDFANHVAEHDPTWLNVFITELKDEDTIIGRYSTILNHLPERKLDRESPPHSTELKGMSKVNLICSVISLPEEAKYLQPKLLCLLSRQPRDIQGALKKIYALEKGQKEAALKFILYFINVDLLFNEALKTYNTDIALMVASTSNKDPKEYLSLLENFDKNTDEDKRRFEIDIFVKDYHRAIEHLRNLIEKSEDEKLKAEYVELVCSKRLYHISLINLSDANHNKMRLLDVIWSKYAGYLLEKRHFTEAGLAYSKAMMANPTEEYLSSALKCFSLVQNDWELTLATLKRSHLTDSIKTKYSENIWRQMLQRGRGAEFIAAFKSNLDSITDNDLRTLITSGSWYLAEMVASRETQVSVREEITSAVIEKFDQHYAELSKDFLLTQERFERLKILLTEYVEKKFDEPRGDNFISDTISSVDGSEVSSMISERGMLKVARSGASSIKTRRSSKSSKSQAAKKKRINLKTGSRHEDLALTVELQNFISKLKVEFENASKLKTALYEYLDFPDASKRAELLGELVENVVSYSRNVTDLLWPSSLMNEQKYSLYKRFGASLHFEDELSENIDLLVLIKPEIPKELYYVTL